jgi:xylulose-5-phosphate/fructose-6-phosphate phosphoketolase
MTVLNDLDRFHLLEDVAVRVEKASAKRDEILRFVAEKLAEHRAHITTVGEDLPEIQEWQWEE